MGKTSEYVPYFEKLKDPRWQKRRLEILQRDGFQCQNCYDRDSTLNVHHWYYTKGIDPWEYEDKAMICLCEECHEQMESLRLAFMRAIAESNWGNGFSEQFRMAIGYLKGCQIDAFGWAVEIDTASELMGMANYNWMRGSKVVDQIDVNDWAGIRRSHDIDEDDNDKKSWLVSQSGLKELAKTINEETPSIDQFQAGNANGYTDAGWWI